MSASICPLCRKPITGASTVDHVFPQAIYKWALDVSDEEKEEIEKNIQSKANRIRVHAKCNYEKQDAIPDINRLHLPMTRYNRLKALERTLRKQVRDFTNLKIKLATGQNNRCIVCGKFLDGTFVIRRVDSTKERSFENACVLCPECNTKIREIKDVLPGDEQTHRSIMAPIRALGDEWKQ